MTFSVETTHKARTAKRCNGCECRIQPGERYARWFGGDGGDIGTLAYHPECRALEIKLNHRLRNYTSEDWYPLHEIIGEFPFHALFAPRAVKRRLRLLGEGVGA